MLFLLMSINLLFLGKRRFYSSVRHCSSTGLYASQTHNLKKVEAFNIYYIDYLLFILIKRSI